MFRIAIAPDKFRGSLTAVQTAEALSVGVRRQIPNADVLLVPIADGGDGTVDAMASFNFQRTPVAVSGPTGETVNAFFASRSHTAVVELANSCGIALLPSGVLQPLTASSRGLGEAVRAALDSGALEIIIGIGGSASTDGGAGLISALGGRLLDEHGTILPDGGGALERLHSLDLSELHAAATARRIVVACDVKNPLSGPQGAARVYGPQKGASPRDVQRLAKGLEVWADVVTREIGSDLRQSPGTGAAGGVGFAALALLGAELRSGIELILSLLDFNRRIAGSDLVITGEGSLDRQTLSGKAPLGVARACARLGVPVVAVCGQRRLSDQELRQAGFVTTYALTDLEADINRCIIEASTLLETLGEMIALRFVPDSSP